MAPWKIALAKILPIPSGVHQKSPARESSGIQFPSEFKLQYPRRSQNLELPSEVARVTSHQAEDSQSSLPSMSLLVWSSPVEVIRDSLPQRQPRIYFPRQQSRRFYLQPSRIHVSLARLAHQLTCAYITFIYHNHC